MVKTGIIYKLVCTDVDIPECYVGSTTNFRKRKCSHKNNSTNVMDIKYHMNVYKYIREHGGFENWDMVQIEEIKFENNRELHARERYWIETLHSKLNAYIPNRTEEELIVIKKDYDAERRIRDQDNINIMRKKYRDENKEKITEHAKISYNCPCGGKYQNTSKAAHMKSSKHHKYIVSIFV
jgi:hypothetical protein